MTDTVKAIAHLNSALESINMGKLDQAYEHIEVVLEYLSSDSSVCVRRDDLRFTFTMLTALNALNPKRTKRDRADDVRERFALALDESD